MAGIDQEMIDDLAQKALTDEKLLMSLIADISPEKKRMAQRESSSKALQQISQTHPETIYSQWDIFVSYLSGDNAFSKFPVVYILANLTRIDGEKKFEKTLDTYFNLLNDESVAISSHVAINSPKIISAKPDLEPKITGKLLGIDATDHTPIHKALIKSHIIEAFDKYFDMSGKKGEIVEFVMYQLDSASAKTKTAAKKFLKSRNLPLK